MPSSFRQTFPGIRRVNLMWTSQLKYADNIAQKMKFYIKVSSVNVTKTQKTADMVTFTKDILNRKLHFLRSVKYEEELLIFLISKGVPGYI